MMILSIIDDQLDTVGITWEEVLNEGLFVLGCPMNRSVGDCLNYVH